MLPRLHLITDLTCLDEQALVLLLAVLAGPATNTATIDAVQVRAKKATDLDVVSWTKALVKLRPPHTRVIVNDRLDLALAAGADGVHLGSHDLAIADARAIAPPGFLIGATCRTPEDAARARDHGADYAGVGPIYDTTTKQGLAPIGLEMLTAAAREIPSIAIGGITSDSVPDVMRAGAHGVAVVSAVWNDPDPRRAAAKIARLVHAA